MTEKKNGRRKLNFNTLSVQMLIVMATAVLLFVAVWMSSRAIITSWVDNVYNSTEAREERYSDYINDLQTYVSENAISSDNTGSLSSWMKDNHNVYLFLYKDTLLFFDGSADMEKPSDNQKPEDSDGESSGEDEGDGGEKDDNNSSGNSNPSGGITGGITTYPTREEILQNAEKNGRLPLEFEDGTLLVSLVDTTDYIYYNGASIGSLAAGMLAFVVTLMLYFTGITRKITRLAKDVRNVYESDKNTKIRTDNGKDELAVLTRNVEQMRSSMLDSLAKEKEALAANSELITAMSHDIRTPLTVLLGYIDIMKETSNEEIKEYLRASEVTAMHLKELSDDMFKYFLISGKGAEAEICAYDARTLAEQLISEHALLLSENGYDVFHENKIDSKTKIIADAQMLMRVVDNAFSNIHKYADKAGRVTILSAEEGDGVVIRFENYIAEKNQKAESNHIGLRSAAKLCEVMGASLYYEEQGKLDKKIFVLEIKLPKEGKK